VVRRKLKRSTSATQQTVREIGNFLIESRVKKKSGKVGRIGSDAKPEDRDS